MSEIRVDRELMDLAKKVAATRGCEITDVLDEVEAHWCYAMAQEQTQTPADAKLNRC